MVKNGGYGKKKVLTNSINNCLSILLLFCDLGGIRTHDPQLRRLLLYPAELPNLFRKSSAKVRFFIETSKYAILFLDSAAFLQEIRMFGWLQFCNFAIRKVDNLSRKEIRFPDFCHIDRGEGDNKTRYLNIELHKNNEKVQL